jgi:phosphate starvation-inducible protein PhoH
MSEQKEIEVAFDNQASFQAVRGANDKHLKVLERGIGIQISVKGNECRLSGDDFAVDLGEKIFN